ncbi:MAG: NAD(P)H-hydrate dehydratase [Gemmatimonadaceae bacterium]
MVRVTSAAQAAARDAAAIAAGVSSRTLMQRAGAAAASEIARLFSSRLGDMNTGHVSILAGPGDNGGDAWVVARALAVSGADVLVSQVGECKGASACAERALAADRVQEGSFETRPIIVDGLLGTGAHGEPRGAIATAIELINRARATGSVVVALDVPSGLDSTTGESTLAVAADVTLTFGTLKRGLLLARGIAGRILVLDIGLGHGPVGLGDEAPSLVNGDWVHRRLPGIPPDAHKGTRKRLVIIGGAVGMAGAPALAARAAMRSGVGMVRMLVAAENVPVVQSLEPFALAGPWPRVGGPNPNEDADVRDNISEWADCVLIGPGLGTSDQARSLAEYVLRVWRGPVVLDADALNVFRDRAVDLGAMLEGRAALLTPHPAEFGRLLGVDTSEVLARRFEIGSELARKTNATVLLKGVPTVVTDPVKGSVVSASGTPVLAAAGSGDLLSGIAATLLAQCGDALTSGACAAWIHGRAAEIATRGGGVRGVTLDEVVYCLRRAWTSRGGDLHYPVLADLPAVASRA